MNPHRHKLILLPPNRVWRPYPGGRTLEQLAGASQPADSFMAEEWIGSTTRSVSRGREAPAEGLSQVRVGHDPALRAFVTLPLRDVDARIRCQPRRLRPNRLFSRHPHAPRRSRA